MRIKVALQQYRLIKLQINVDYWEGFIDKKAPKLGAKYSCVDSILCDIFKMEYRLRYHQ